MKTILVAEDEQAIREFVVINLKRAGYETLEAANGEEALKICDREGPKVDVAVLDIMMPGKYDGLAVCKELRRRSNSIGIILLTAKTQEMDKVGGLMMGADDYVTKPFSPREVVARVQAMLRRPRGGVRGAASGRGVRADADAGGAAAARREVRLGDLVVDRGAREVRVDGRAVDLTRTEFDLLVELATHPRQVLTRAQLMRAVAGPSWVGDEHAADVHVGHIRRKIGDDPGGRGRIRTVRGVGYRMEDA